MFEWQTVLLNDVQMTHCTVKWCSNDTLLTVKWCSNVQTNCAVKWCSNDTLYG